MDSDRTDRSVPQALLAARYRLDGVIGRGGVADVHRAHDTVLGRDVALKVVRGDSPDPAALERFTTEMRTHAGLSHPNLVTVLDAGAHEGRPFLVMELVEGGTLADMLERPVAPGRVAAIAAGIAAGLAHVHERGVVHRDLKPANVLLGDNGRVALSDFGVARLRDAEHGHTASGFTIGTASYFAPEQVTGSDVTPAADVYALGLVMIEALCGRRVYDGPPAQAALARLRNAPRIPRRLPPPLRELLRRMTAQDPEQRPRADAVERALRRLLPVLRSLPPLPPAPTSADRAELSTAATPATPAPPYQPPAAAGSAGVGRPPPGRSQPAALAARGLSDTPVQPLPPARPAPVAGRSAATPGARGGAGSPRTSVHPRPAGPLPGRTVGRTARRTVGRTVDREPGRSAGAVDLREPTHRELPSPVLLAIVLVLCVIGFVLGAALVDATQRASAQETGQAVVQQDGDPDQP